jgi:hypothetical protein
MPRTKTAKATPAKPGADKPGTAGTARTQPAKSGAIKPGTARGGGARRSATPAPATSTRTASPAAAPATGPAAGRARVRTVRLAGGAAPIPALPAAVADTPAARALWAALHAHPDATTADLAAAAGIGRSTATGMLVGFADAGLATRTPGGGTGRARRPDRWSTTPAPAPVRAPASPTPSRAAATGAFTAAGVGAPQDDAISATPVPPGGKLTGGQLRDLVAAHLRAHPDQDLGPTAIAKHLDRSAGAVANACLRLIALGQATQTSRSPRRYRATTG